MDTRKFIDPVDLGIEDALNEQIVKAYEDYINEIYICEEYLETPQEDWGGTRD